MIAELGLAMLWLAGALALLQLTAGALALTARGRELAGIVRPVAVVQGVLCAGAFLASGVLRFLFPDHPNLGATLPAGTAAQSFVLEVILTLLLMFVAL